MVEGVKGHGCAHSFWLVFVLISESAGRQEARESVLSAVEIGKEREGEREIGKEREGEREKRRREREEEREGGREREGERERGRREREREGERREMSG